MTNTALCIKRIKRDLEKYDFTLSENNFVCFIYKKKKISFYLNSSYPFVLPKININDKLLSYQNSFFPKKLLHLYKNTFNECICCNNMYCPDRWSPALTIINVLDEYYKIKNLMVDLYKKQLIDYIKLPDDILGVIKEYII